MLQEIKILKGRVNELYGLENHYVLPYNSTYQDMEKAFLAGNASRENILKDAETLGLDMNIVSEFLDDEMEPVSLLLPDLIRWNIIK